MPEFEEMRHSSDNDKPYKPSEEKKTTPQAKEGTPATPDVQVDGVNAESVQEVPKSKKANFTPGPIPGPFDAQEETTEPAVETAPVAKTSVGQDNRPNMRSRWKRKGSQQGSVAAQPESKVGAIDDLSEVKDALSARQPKPKAPEPTLRAQPSVEKNQSGKHQYVSGAVADEMAQHVLPNKNDKAVSPRKSRDQSFDTHLSQAMDTAPIKTDNEADTDMNKRYNNGPRRPYKKKGFLSNLLSAIASIFGGGKKKKPARRGSRPGGNRGGSRQGSRGGKPRAQQGGSRGGSRQGGAKPRSGGGNRRPQGNNRPRSGGGGTSRRSTRD